MKPYQLLLAGFPCQPFSSSGLRRGFEDPRGNMFFEIARLTNATKPECLVLENVRNFSTHDGGRTLKTVIEVLHELRYATDWRVLNAVDFGLPQNRERTIIVASRLGQPNLADLETKPRKCLLDILEDEENVPRNLFVPNRSWTRLDEARTKTQPSSGLKFVGYLNKRIRKNGVRPGTEHLSRVHRQCNRVHSVLGSIPTLSASETSGRYYIELENGEVRKLTLRECYRAQGFPDSFILHPRASEAYRQIGNSVPIPMIESVMKRVAEGRLVSFSG
jgi:DNA (cytosine-5)-methyltransferase 1